MAKVQTKQNKIRKKRDHNQISDSDTSSEPQRKRQKINDNDSQSQTANNAKWACKTCTLENGASVDRCAVCDTPRHDKSKQNKDKIIEVKVDEIDEIDEKDNSLKMCSTLISMGFDKDLSMRAANEYPKDAQGAIQWILTQQSQSSASNKNKHPKSSSSNKDNSPPSKIKAEPSTDSHQNNNNSDGNKSNNIPPLIPEVPQSSNTQRQDLESWIAQNKLSQSVPTALKESDVNSIDDLYVLTVEDIEEFVKELGLKTIQRKKVQRAITSLLQNNQQQTQNTIPPISRLPAIAPPKPEISQISPMLSQQIPPMRNYDAYAASQAFNNVHNPSSQLYPRYPYAYPNANSHPIYPPMQNIMHYNPYDSSKNLMNVDPNNGESDHESAEDKKKRERKERTAHLRGEIKVQHSLKKRRFQRRNRCILVIGATGTGKTTCLNSMMNYLWEVEYEDKFRYKLILENKNANQAKSQTQKVTAYYLNPPTLDYSLTLVDTPGIVAFLFLIVCKILYV